MQKTVRINLQARKNVLKQVNKKRVKDAKTEWNQYHQQKLSTERTARQYVKEERAHRREDWILGPLAPNRNVGTNKGTYGTVDVEMIQSPAIPKQVQGGPKRPGYDVMEYEGKHKGIAFTGDTIVGNVVVDDRVVVVHGPERIRGIIGDVLSVDYQREELRITNVNVVSTCSFYPAQGNLSYTNNPVPGRYQDPSYRPPAPGQCREPRTSPLQHNGNAHPNEPRAPRRQNHKRRWHNQRCHHPPRPRRSSLCPARTRLEPPGTHAIRNG